MEAHTLLPRGWKLHRRATLLLLAGALGFLPFAAAAPAKTDLALYAPDPFYLEKHGFLIGTPDRTGCPRWVMGRITASLLRGPGDRSKSQWHADRDALPERHARDSDYINSGLSRGHCWPAANAVHSQTAMDDTHSLANVVPQFQEFNAQSWEKLEEYGRSLTVDGSTVTIVVLPVWKPQVSHLKGNGAGQTHTHELIVKMIGLDEIWIPTHLGMSLLIEPAEGPRRIESFLVANSDTVAREDFKVWRCATDDLESAAVTDLWHGVPKEKELEAQSHRE